MRYLLDACTFLWMDYAPERLGPKATTLLNDAGSDLCLSSVTAWEILAKNKSGKLPLPQDAATFLNTRLQQYNITKLPFDIASAMQLAELTLHHRDPFDLMLICQAIHSDCTIITPDEYIRSYPIKTAW